MRICWIAGLIVSALALSTKSSAAVIDFEDSPDNFADPGVSGGYVFDYSAQGWGMLSDSYNDFGRVHNGTTTLAFAGTASVSFKPTDDSSFSLSGLDLANFKSGYSDGSVTITGYYEAGGTTSQQIDFSAAWGSYALNGTFTGLDHVVIQDDAVGGFYDVAGVQIDNLQVNAVPEPATFAALGLGLAALRRRRRK